MKTEKNNAYLDINRESWNNRVDSHMASEFYDLDGFLKGKSSLNPIEMALLGDVSGKKILHLQCHFGQDTLSLAREGARVTGVDISDKAIEEAKILAEKCGVQARFVCCDLYSLPEVLEDTFDIVFTSYGTIGWLPDLNKWAQVIDHFLKPGGKFVFAEFHPVVWMFDDDFKDIAYSYFNTGPISETEEGTYADRNAAIKQEYVTWNHPISDVLNSLMGNNLQIQRLEEYDYSPYNCFNNTVEDAPGVFRIKTFDRKFPMVYSLLARKTK